MSSPRVALLLDTEAFGGTERHVLDLARALPAENAVPLVVCPPSSALSDHAKAASVATAPCAPGRAAPRTVRALKALVRSGQVDIVHAHNGRTLMAGVLAVRLAGRGRTVYTQHFMQPAHAAVHGLKGRASRAAHRSLNRRCGRHIAISAAVRDAMLARGDVPAERIAVIPHGIPDVGESRLTPAQAMRQELRLAADAPIIAYAGRLEAEKDVATLVRAAGIVARRAAGVVCLIAGDGAQREPLEQLAAQSGANGAVRFLGFRTDAVAIIGCADIFCLPSAQEGFGLAILEAMALARPVVATDAGGPREIVVDGETGLLVPPSQPERLAEALLYLSGDGARRTAFGCAGRERFLRMYTVEQMARKTARLYAELLAC